MNNPDVEALLKTRNEDLWVYDKLILSKILGYNCGPKGMEVPKPGKYIIRPAINFMGMALGAKIIHLEKSTEHLEDGFFWCEVFKGRHLSVDYKNKKQDLCVEGFRAKNSKISKWTRWEKTSDKIKYPKILKKLKGNYKWVNIEYIGDNIIEIHFRRNPDFLGHSSKYIRPIWDNEIFIKAKDADRVGFYIEGNNES